MKRKVRAWAIKRVGGIIEATTEEFRARNLLFRAEERGLKYEIYPAIITYELPKKKKGKK